MSILSGFKPFKNRIKTSDGYQLVSQWTHTDTVEFSDGDNLSDKYGSTSISSIGDGSLTGAISSLDSEKQDVITGAASTIVSDNLTASRVAVALSNGKIGVSSTTTNEIAYVHGVTSNIQTQLNNKVGFDILNVASDSRLLTVGAKGASYKNINDAITHALTLSPTKTNPVTIFIYPGSYTEQIVLDDKHGINFIGCGIDKTIIQYNGSYPNCVVHVQGDYSFSNLTIKSLNANTYAVHIDPVDSTVEGRVAFEHCRIMGGISAIGYGSGKNTELYVKDCILSGTQNILYAHNCAYANRTGQKLTVLNNFFERGSESKVVLLDDAGYSNGGVLSPMDVVFSGNTYNYMGFGQILFRKNTYASSLDTTYLPINDANIRCGTGNDNNSGLPGLNYGKGYYVVSTYAIVPTVVDGSGMYQFTIPTTIYTPNYSCSLISATVPSYATVTSYFSITGVSEYGINISTSESSMCGRGIAFAIECKVL